MRRFLCDRCASRVGFDAFRCGSCGTELGYVVERYGPCALTRRSATSYLVDDSSIEWHRCLNAAWGCNWMLPADTPGDWCRSCRLTRGRPDESDTSAVEAWATAEAAKRRLVHQLDELDLPLDAIVPGAGALAFDLVYVPGEVRVTGYLDGVVTLDLTDTDDARREALRRAFAEPLRTVIGHLRHEVGHFYWPLLAVVDGSLEPFRQLFGDERVDYATAIHTHHSHQPSSAPADPDFISPYAASHPSEDWAESFAHYLHVHDALGSAVAAGIDVGPIASTETHPTEDYRAQFAGWLHLAAAVNDVTEALGLETVYRFDPGPGAIDKLVFVHERLVDHRRRIGEENRRSPGGGSS